MSPMIPAPDATLSHLGHTPLVSVEALRSALGIPGLHLVDARFDLADPAAGERAWRQARLPGAVHLDLDRDLSDHSRPAIEGRHPLPASDVLRAALAERGIGPGDTVVVYDAGNGAMAAARAWWLLRGLGLDARVLDGGFAAWQAAGGLLEDGDPVPPAARIMEGREWPAVDPARCIGRDALAARGPEVLLVDARPAERFRGDVEPLDPRAGHIPGARSRPFSANLEGGRFKAADRLAAEWRALIDGRDPAAVVVSCGSGVTACHHALAMVQAGLPMPRLFAPSWSGWVADPAAPVATGPD